MAKPRREALPSDKTQHGDPTPDLERQGQELTQDEIVQPAQVYDMRAPTPVVKAVTDGPIALAKRCAECGQGLPVDAATCPVCAPFAKVTPPGGVNAIDPTARAQLPPPRQGDPPWWMQPVVNRR